MPKRVLTIFSHHRHVTLLAMAGILAEATQDADNFHLSLFHFQFETFN